MEDVIKISFTEDTMGESILDGITFFKEHIQPVVPTAKCNVLFELNADTVPTRFVWGAFTAFMDYYTMDHEDLCESMGIAFSDASLQIVFDLVHITYIHSVNTIIDIEEAEEDEEELDEESAPKFYA